VALEIDGGQHAGSDAQAYDESRSAYLKTRGIEVLRFWNNEILQNMDGVLCRIAEEITPPSLPFIKEEGQEKTNRSHPGRDTDVRSPHFDKEGDRGRS